MIKKLICFLFHNRPQSGIYNAWGEPLGDCYICRLKKEKND